MVREVFALCHSTDASAQVAASALSHTTETAWSKFCPQGKRVRLHAICVRLRVLFTAPGFVLSSLRWTAVHLFSFHSHVKQMPHIWHRDKGCRVVWLRGEEIQICADFLECFTFARDGTCHFVAHLLNATSCQVVAKIVKGF